MSLLPHSYFRFASLETPPAWEKLRQTILQQCLPTSKISGFNDPYECAPVCVGDTEALLDIRGQNGASTAWSMLAADIRSKMLGKSLKLSEIISIYRSSLSVVCFSRRINSALLWSHYSAGYRGIALHFLPSNAPDSTFNQQSFHWVNYEKQRPFLSSDVMKYYFDTTIENPAGAFAPNSLGATELQFMSAILTWKSDDWSYEQEARLIVPVGQDTVKIRSDELASIIIGPRCPPEREERIKYLVEQSGLKVRIAQARLSQTDYSVEIEWR